MTNLDTNNNTALNNLICVGNQLTSLDVRKNLVLTRLDCSGNQLSADAMNELFASLPEPISMFGKLNIGDNPGTRDCDRNIAEDKGWWVS
jgi:Leucine-rich repeat (LRR) protein